MSVVEHASWHRKLAAAFISEGNSPAAEMYLHMALDLLGYSIPSLTCMMYWRTMISIHALHWGGDNLRQGGCYLAPRANITLSQEQRLQYLEAVRVYEKLAIVYVFNANLSLLSMLEALKLCKEVWAGGGEDTICPELARVEANLAVYFSCRVTMETGLVQRMCQRAAIYAEKCDHFETEADVFYNVASVYTGMGAWTSAKEMISKSESMCSSLKFSRKISEVLRLLSVVHWFEGSYKKVREYCKMTLEADNTLSTGFAYASSLMMFQQTLDVCNKGSITIRAALIIYMYVYL